MSKHITNLCSILAALAGLVAIMAAPAVAQETITLQLGTAANPSWSLGKDINEVLKPKLEEYSDGRLEIAIHDRGSLCSEHGCIEQLSLGQIDIATVSSGNVGAFGTAFDIINLPYIFRDDESAHAIMTEWLADELAERAAEEMNLHVIAIVPVGGFRQVVNTEREVRVPADLRGLKIRVTKSPTEFNLVKAWGAVPVPYDWSQLYEGLQQGVVQGMYLQDPFTAAAGFYEVVSHITHVGAAYSAHPIVMDRDRYQALPDWAKEAFAKVREDLERESYGFDIAWQQAAVAEMEGRVEIYKPNSDEMALWHQGAKEAWLEVQGTYDTALARRVLEEQNMDDLIADLEAVGAL